MGNCVIQVANKRKESVTVGINTTTAVRVLGDSLSLGIPGYECIKSFLTDDEGRVPPGETTVINDVGVRKFFSYTVGCIEKEWYKIKVTTEDGEWEAECETPLHCNWIVDDDKIYQQDDPQKFKRFCVERSSNIIKVVSQTKEFVCVVVNRHLLLQILDNDLLLGIGSYVKDKCFKEVQVEPGRKKAIQKMNTRGLLANIVEKLMASTCLIKVIRKRDELTVQCETPLHCTWIVQGHGMWQENKPEKVYKFQ